MQSLTSALGGDLINTAKKQGYKAIMVAFMLAHAANDGFGGLFPPLLPLIRESYNLNYSQLGGFITLFRFFGGILQIPVGYLAYFIPSSTLMVTGLLWVSIGLLIGTFSKSYWMLASSFSFAGIGCATFHPLSFSVLSKLFNKEILGRIIGLHMGASSAAHLIGPILILLLANRFGWYWPIRVWSVFGIIAAVFMLLVLRRNTEKEQKAEGKAFMLPFISTSLVLFVLFRMGWTFAWKGMATFLPLFLVETAQFSVKFATLFYMAMYLIELFARPIVGDISDRLGNRKALIMAECIMCAVLFMALIFIKAKLILLFIVLGLGFFAGTMPVVAQAYAIEMIPYKQRERTLGFFFTLNAVATILSPLGAGFIADHFGLTESFVALTALIGVSLIFLYFTNKNK